MANRPCAARPRQAGRATTDKPGTGCFQRFGGAGGAPTKPSFVNGDAVNCRIASVRPNIKADTEAVSTMVERCAPEYVHSALMASPG